MKEQDSTFQIFQDPLTTLIALVLLSMAAIVLPVDTPAPPETPAVDATPTAVTAEQLSRMEADVARLRRRFDSLRVAQADRERGQRSTEERAASLRARADELRRTIAELRDQVAILQKRLELARTGANSGAQVTETESGIRELEAVIQHREAELGLLEAQLKEVKQAASQAATTPSDPRLLEVRRWEEQVSALAQQRAALLDQLQSHPGIGVYLKANTRGKTARLLEADGGAVTVINEANYDYKTGVAMSQGEMVQYVELTRKKKATAEDINQLPLATSAYQKRLAELKPEGDYLMFAVRANAFDVFLAARQIAWQRGFRVAWVPVEGALVGRTGSGAEGEVPARAEWRGVIGLTLRTIAGNRADAPTSIGLPGTEGERRSRVAWQDSRRGWRRVTPAGSCPRGRPARQVQHRAEPFRARLAARPDGERVAALPRPRANVAQGVWWMRAEQRSDQGKRRENNEDWVLVDEALGFCLLADGMGGCQAGEIASQAATQAAAGHLGTGLRAARQSGEIADLLVHSVRRAHEAVREAARTSPTRAGMGTTLVALVLREGTAYVCSVGDSRAYVIDKGIRQITEDQTVGALLVKNGLMGRGEVPPRQWHVLTQSIGAAGDLVLECRVEDLAPGALVLLCSDGLTDMLPDEEILSIIRADRDDLGRAADHLVLAANAKGGVDNISVVLAAHGGPAGSPARPKIQVE